MPLAPMMAPQTTGPTGPASPPTGNPGLAADALSKVREAVRLLEQALPGLEVGSKPHKAVIDSLGKLTTAVPASEEVPGVQMTQLAGLQQKAQQSSMMQALMRSMSQGSAPPSPGGAPPELQAA